MSIQTLVFLGVLLIAVANSLVLPPFFNPLSNTNSSADFPGVLPSDYFLQKAQAIATAKKNKAFEMKKEGVKIAQQSMLNKFALFSGDETKKNLTEIPLFKNPFIPTSAAILNNESEFEDDYDQDELQDDK